MPLNRRFGINTSRALGNVGDFVANLILQNKEQEAKLNQDTQKSIAGMMQANQERQNLENAFIDPSQNNLSRLTGSQLSRYKAIQKIINPQTKPDEIVGVQFNKPKIYGFNKTKGKIQEFGDNPYYSPPTYTDEGYNDKGQKIIKVFNKDSGELLREVPTGFYKSDQYKETKQESFEPSSYAKSSRYYTQQLSNLQNLQAKIKSDYFLSNEETQAAKSKLENETKAFSREVYLQLDDQSKKWLDENEPKTYLESDNKIIANKLIDTILNDFKEGKLNYLKGTKYKDNIPDVVQNTVNYIKLKYATR